MAAGYIEVSVFYKHGNNTYNAIIHNKINRNEFKVVTICTLQKLHMYDLPDNIKPELFIHYRNYMILTAFDHGHPAAGPWFIPNLVPLVQVIPGSV